MIRKWPYISPIFDPAKLKIQLSTDYKFNSLLAPFSVKTKKARIESYAFKVFRKTTRFYKWRRGLSRPFRRNYMKRKRRTDYYMASFLTYNWSKDYQRRRHLVRFLQSINLGGLEALAADKYVFFKKLPDVSRETSQGLSIYTCSVALVRASLLFSDNVKNFFFHPSFSGTSRVQSATLEGIQNSAEVGVGSLHLEGLSYPIDTYDVMVKETRTVAAKNLHDAIFKQTLLIVHELRKLLTYLVLHVVN